MTAGPVFLSIDFEDFSHDLGRDLGLWDTRPLRVTALTRAYEAIDRFAASRDVRLTFFCTGLVARDAPDLVARMAADGHEVACHYDFHDHIDEETPAEFENNLRRGLARLRDASGQAVTGFRAPKFRIPQTGTGHYEVLARHLDYDSSFLCNRQADAAAFAGRINGDLSVLPIYSDRLRLGGSYLKLFPLRTTLRLIARCRAAGMTPHIYLHPYEFVSDGSFLLSSDELAPLGRKAATYWRLRQAQWHRVGNRGLPRKIAAIADAHGLGGRLDRHIDRLAA